MTMTDFERQQLREMKTANRMRSARLLASGIIMIGFGLFFLLVADGFGAFPRDSLLHRLAVEVSALEERLINMK